MTEATLPLCVSLAAQYNQRDLFEVCQCPDDRLTSQYWQAVSAHEDVEQYLVSPLATELIHELFPSEFMFEKFFVMEVERII